MAHSATELQRIADRHGIALADVKGPSLDERLAMLEETLTRTDVPFPIDPDKQASYLAAARRGEPFGVGDLGQSRVELGKYANFQWYDQYTPADHLSWACLVRDQQLTKKEFACEEYLNGEALFEIGGNVIPEYYLLNARIYQQTQWQLATVNMIIPAELFFTCHSRRFFPVTTFMRGLEVDYLQEPDIGHDVAGHVATFTIPAVANVMKNHGTARDLIYLERDQQIAEAQGDPRQIAEITEQAEELLNLAGRIYWFMVEFGLVMQRGQVRCFGAGILSSPGETTYSINSPESNRILIDPSSDADLLRMANTDYLISEFQKTYFISENFELLNSITPDRIIRAAKAARDLPDFNWREIVPGDRIIDLGTIAMTTNEKYFRLMNGDPMDPCVERSAIRNLANHAAGFDLQNYRQLRALPAAIPPGALEWYRQHAASLHQRLEALSASP